MQALGKTNLRNLSGKKKIFWNPPPPPKENPGIRACSNSFLRSASNTPTPGRTNDSLALVVVFLGFFYRSHF